MSSINRIILADDTNGIGITGFSGPADSATILRKVSDHAARASGGACASNLQIAVNPVAATATVTITGTGTNTDTLTVLGTVITMVTSGALPASNQINIGVSVTAVANQIVGLINGTTALSPNSWAGKCTATNVAGVITLACAIPGVIGNVLLATAKSSTAITITNDFGLAIAGSEGTSKTFSLGL